MGISFEGSMYPYSATKRLGLREYAYFFIYFLGSGDVEYDRRIALRSFQVGRSDACGLGLAKISVLSELTRLRNVRDLVFEESRRNYLAGDPHVWTGDCPKSEVRRNISDA